MLCLLIFVEPFLVMRTHGSFNHPGPDEVPIAISLQKAALAASVGNDPTIGGPARVATRAGPFLSERWQDTDSRSYKGGLRRVGALSAWAKLVPGSDRGS
jgi:hypothetical protein